MSSLSIVIVNWNSGSQLRACLDSIEGALSETVQLSVVIVVDNGSSDSSADFAEEEFQFGLEWIRNSENRGFAAACNQGAARCAGDYILFLNPDTLLFDKSLGGAIAFLESEAGRGVGILGVQLFDRDSTIARSCSRFPTTGMFLCKMIGLERLLSRLGYSQPMLDWDHETSRIVDQVIGAFFLARRRLFLDLHGFDERFFVYYEEVDFSLRALKAGWKSYYFADGQAYHRGGGTSEQVPARRLFYNLRSRLLYAFKHFSPPSAWTLLFATMLLEPISRVAFALLKGRVAIARITLVGFRELWSALPKIVRQAGR